MSGRILVTYASRTGSTAEIAGAIGNTLSAAGAQVDLLPVQDVKDLSPAFGIFPKGDHRDWNAVRAWAERCALC